MIAGLRNVHFSAPTEPDHGLPRERMVTNSPAREYERRPGAVERIPDELAAIILCSKRMATVKRGEVKLEINKRKYKFFHPDSITLRGYTGETRVPVVFNRLENPPLFIHVMTRDGVYVETLPRKGLAQFFSPGSSGRELAAIRRYYSHVEGRLQHIHESDSEQAMEDARHNKDAITKGVYDLPLKSEKESPRAVPHQNASRLTGAMEEARASTRIPDRARTRLESVSQRDISAATSRERGAPSHEFSPDEISHLLRDDR